MFAGRDQRSNHYDTPPTTASQMPAVFFHPLVIVQISATYSNTKTRKFSDDLA